MRGRRAGLLDGRGRVPDAADDALEAAAGERGRYAGAQGGVDGDRSASAAESIGSAYLAKQMAPASGRRQVNPPTSSNVY